MGEVRNFMNWNFATDRAFCVLKETTVDSQRRWDD